MPTGCPKLRRDLVISRQETGSGIYFVVKDPASGRFYRIREAEHFIAQQLDGSTPLDVIRERVEEKFGAPLARETLERFAKNFHQLGLLESEKSEFGHLAGGQGRLRGNLLYLRLKAFDPDRFLSRIVGQTRFFFTPYFLALSVILILFAFGVAIFNRDEIVRDLPRLYRFDALLLAWVTMLTVVTLHEFAHGLTCKHFGGEVHEMEFMLIYFQPAFYCNVSDAWLFSQKSRRLWVTFAGAYFELFLWALATFAWRFSDPETWIHFFTLVVMATSGIKTFFNLNPLIKLDGYYLLSDYLEIPNLRQKSFKYIGGRISRLWGMAADGEDNATPRERRIYIIYGIFAATFSFWLLAWISLKLGNYLIGQYQFYGLILFLLLFWPRIRGRFRRLFAKSSVSIRPALGLVASLTKRTAALAALAAVPAGFFFITLELKVSGEFKVLPIHNADIRAEVDGIIEGIYVNEGDRVKEGDSIARLIDRDYRAELHKTAAEIDEKRAKLKKLKTGPIQEEIDVARAVVAKAREQLKHAKSLLSMSEAAFERQLISQKEYQEAQAKVAVQEKELEETQNKLKVLLAGSRKEEIEATEAEIARLETQRGYVREQIKLVSLASPISGIVTTPSAKFKEMIGQHLKKGDLVAEIHELKTVTAEIAISEREIADVKVGDTVAVKARAYPGETFYGKVISIAATAGSGADEKANPSLGAGRANVGEKGTVLVTTQLDNRFLLLKPEMTGKAKIFCGERSLLDLTARRLARTFAVELWSWW